MKEKKCLFCEIYQNRKNEIIFENKYFYARFDQFPLTPGHLEIIPKRHVASLVDLTIWEWIALLPAIKEVKKIVESTDFKQVYKNILKDPPDDKARELCRKILTHVGIDKKPDGYNFGINDGQAAGQTIHHLHIHIIPRYFGDVPDPRGGVRLMFGEKLGNYKK